MPTKPPSRKAAPAPQVAADASPPEPPPDSSNRELGLTERRRGTRTLPVPLAVESDRDTDWAIFQALMSDQHRI